MHNVDFITIVKYAWLAYDSSRSIEEITDISAQVSTNHVYKIVLADQSFVIAKLSHFGTFNHFVEDHTIINALSNNLPYPFDHFLSRALMYGDKIFVHRFTNREIDAWIIFYRPIGIHTSLPKKLPEDLIVKLGGQFGKFHRACHSIRHTLPPSSKTTRSDIERLLKAVEEDTLCPLLKSHYDDIRYHCNQFLSFIERPELDDIERIPVFIDWNIGNFSITEEGNLYSRWDYDWFRMSSRMMDFYFLSRIVSEVGDRTTFTYNVEPMMEDRFMIFLEAYHKEYPLTRAEIELMGEVYRFFILHYVIQYGQYFFIRRYADQFQTLAFKEYLPSVRHFDPQPIINHLKI